MPTRGHYIPEWRQYRGRISLAKLAQRMEVAPGEEFLSSVSIGRIERDEQPLTMKILYRIAAALEADPIEVLTVNPLRHPEQIGLCKTLRALPADKVVTARRLIEAII